MSDRRFTDEEMSRVLSAHAAGLLIPSGQAWSCFRSECGTECAQGCVRQFAENESDPDAFDGTQDPIVRRFDTKYRSSMTPEQLIKLLDGAFNA